MSSYRSTPAVDVFHFAIIPNVTIGCLNVSTQKVKIIYLSSSNSVETYKNAHSNVQKCIKIAHSIAQFKKISPNNADIGNIRETIFFAWLQERYFISSSKVADFEAEEYVFEVGGRKKGQAQIASVPQGKGFIVKDDVERAIGNIIPLWMFGFVY